MDDEDHKKRSHAVAIPRVLEALSVDDLRNYAGLLEEEKARVLQEIERKKHVRAAADNFFKV